MGSRFICADTVMVDLVLEAPSLPPRGGDVTVQSRSFFTGGGFNAMAAAARQNVSVVYAGLLGHGPFAQQARDELRAEGIELPLESGGRDIGVCIVVVEPDGERSFVTSPGAEVDTSIADLQRVSPHSGDLVYFSGYDFLTPSLASACLEWLATFADDVMVAFDPGPRVADISDTYLDQVLSRTDWLLLNVDEAKSLLPETQEIDVARRLAERVREGVVVHAGAHGCVLATLNTECTVAAPAVSVRDTNGAGDTHNGVFLASLLRGDEPLTAARKATFAASRAVTQLGPAQSPRLEEITAWFNSSSF